MAWVLDTKENCIGQKGQTWTALPRDLVSECCSSQVTTWVSHISERVNSGAPTHNQKTTVVL